VIVAVFPRPSVPYIVFEFENESGENVNERRLRIVSLKNKKSLTIGILFYLKFKASLNNVNFH
jgi:hypothetical protein